MFGAPKKAPPNPKDLVKANRRQVQKSQNEIQREIAQLDRREKETLAEIKKLAAKGQNGAVRMLAKQVVTIRAQKERMQRNHAQLHGLKTMGSAMAANLAMSNAMTGTARVMTAVNATASVESMQAAMQEMEKSMQISEMQEDMLDDLLMEDDVDEDVEAEEVMSQVLDEIGLDLTQSLVAATATPSSPMASASRAQTTSPTMNSTSRRPITANSMHATAASSSNALSFDEPLTAQEEAEAERLLAELGV